MNSKQKNKQNNYFSDSFDFNSQQVQKDRELILQQQKESNRYSYQNNDIDNDDCHDNRNDIDQNSELEKTNYFEDPEDKEYEKFKSQFQPQPQKQEPRLKIKKMNKLIICQHCSCKLELPSEEITKFECGICNKINDLKKLISCYYCEAKLELTSSQNITIFECGICNKINDLSKLKDNSQSKNEEENRIIILVCQHCFGKVKVPKDTDTFLCGICKEINNDAIKNNIQILEEEPQQKSQKQVKFEKSNKNKDKKESSKQQKKKVKKRKIKEFLKKLFSLTKEKKKNPNQQIKEKNAEKIEKQKFYYQQSFPQMTQSLYQIQQPQLMQQFPTTSYINLYPYQRQQTMPVYNQPYQSHIIQQPQYQNVMIQQQLQPQPIYQQSMFIPQNTMKVMPQYPQTSQIIQQQSQQDPQYSVSQYFNTQDKQQQMKKQKVQNQQSNIQKAKIAQFGNNVQIKPNKQKQQIQQVQSIYGKGQLPENFDQKQKEMQNIFIAKQINFNARIKQKSKLQNSAPQLSNIKPHPQKNKKIKKKTKQKKKQKVQQKVDTLQKQKAQSLFLTSSFNQMMSLMNIQSQMILQQQKLLKDKINKQKKNKQNKQSQVKVIKQKNKPMQQKTIKQESKQISQSQLKKQNRDKEIEKQLELFQINQNIQQKNIDDDSIQWEDLLEQTILFGIDDEEPYIDLDMLEKTMINEGVNLKQAEKFFKKNSHILNYTRKQSSNQKLKQVTQNVKKQQPLTSKMIVQKQQTSERDNKEEIQEEQKGLEIEDYEESSEEEDEESEDEELRQVLFC